MVGEREPPLALGLRAATLAAVPESLIESTLHAIFRWQI